MSSNPDPHKDEHIEDLLSQLQGIFGRLSQSEEDPSKQPAESPPPQKEKKPAPQPPPPPVEMKPVPMDPFAPPDPSPFETATPPPQAPPPMEAPPLPAEVPTPVASAPPPVQAPPPVAAASPPAASSQGYESSVPLSPEDKTIIPSSVFFTMGRETEAKALAQKLETMTPKFTKVAFRLRVGVFLPFDPKSEWKDNLVAQAQGNALQTVFLLTERPLEEARRKAIVGELEALGIYFQEVPVASVEKKAFYTDILLGLVFFFDSRKPSGGESV